MLVKFRKACEVSKLMDIFHVITSAKQLSLSGSGVEVSPPSLSLSRRMGSGFMRQRDGLDTGSGVGPPPQGGIS